MRISRASALFALLTALLVLALAHPLAQVFWRSLHSREGSFVGLANFQSYFATPQLALAFLNTLGAALLTTLITVALALVLAFALTHSRVAGGGLCRMAAMLPMFVPSFFPAMGLIYLFGEQGAISWMLGGRSLYGPIGVVMGSVIYTLPFASLLLIGALREIDQNLYLAARGLGAGAIRRFFTVTLPGASYALISAGIVVFTLTVADFGIPKVLGGNFSMLSTEIFKQVVGMQNFPIGATVSMVLLFPVIPAFLLDAWANRRALRRRLASRAGKAKLNPGPGPLRDAACTLAAWLVAFLPLGVTLMLVLASLVSFWPYSLDLSLANYSFEQTIYGLEPYLNSLQLALLVAVTGVILTFSGAYIAQRVAVAPLLRALYRFLAILPLCVPGTVLGLAYVFAFNQGGGMLGTLLATGMTLMVLNTVVHVYPVCHLNFSDSLARLDRAYEAAGASLGAGRACTLRRVIIPMQGRAVLEVFFYLFVSALTTISALVFIYPARYTPASVAMLQMFDSGLMGEASAMGVLILLTALGLRLFINILQKYFCR
ncbi:ABC transporter permease subunit [Desulfovibrio sp. OttesenSCG-928-C14]|nr:ABC transporter permease subunit [Desulfovibrio sp. OttesenSCG-928-C14]